MLKRLGIAVAIPIGIFGYVYLCKYLYSLLDPTAPSYWQWSVGLFVFGFIAIPLGSSIIYTVLNGIRCLIVWIIGNGDKNDKNIIPTYYLCVSCERLIPGDEFCKCQYGQKLRRERGNRESDYTESLKELDELFPGMQRSNK